MLHVVEKKFVDLGKKSTDFRTKNNMKAMKATADTSPLSSNWVNLLAYPIHSSEQKLYQTTVQHARQQLQETGCASFPHFFTSAAVKASLSRIKPSSPAAFSCNNFHNAFQLPGTDANYSNNHPRNVFMQTRVASLAYDELNREGPLYQLYNDDAFVRFVRDVTNQKELHRLKDPLGACTVNIFKPGWYHAWHFDESEYTTTLCLQQSEAGGEFQFTPPIRHDQSIDSCSPAVSSILNTHSKYNTTSVKSSSPLNPRVNVKAADFDAGTLQIFAGRYSFHRVTQIPVTAQKDRLVAVLCFSTEKNVINSPEVQKMFWGRTVSSVLSSSKL